jgi:hypothetical protein
MSKTVRNPNPRKNLFKNKLKSGDVSMFCKHNDVPSTKEDGLRTRA